MLRYYTFDTAKWVIPACYTKCSNPAVSRICGLPSTQLRCLGENENHTIVVIEPGAVRVCTVSDGLKMCSSG